MSYQPTSQGVQEIIKDLTPTLISLWKTERENKSDDVVAIIDVATNNVDLRSRMSTWYRIKRHNPDSDLLERLLKPAAKNGAVTIWAIIGFSEGQVAAAPVVLALS